MPGDNWNGIMKDTLREECDDSEECLQNCCIATFVSSLFFVVFVLVAQVSLKLPFYFNHNQYIFVINQLTILVCVGQCGCSCLNETFRRISQTSTNFTQKYIFYSQI